MKCKQTLKRFCKNWYVAWFPSTCHGNVENTNISLVSDNDLSVISAVYFEINNFDQ